MWWLESDLEEPWNGATTPTTTKIYAVVDSDKQHLTMKSYGILLNWLEKPENFQLLHGGGSGRTQIGGRVQT